MPGGLKQKLLDRLGLEVYRSGTLANFLSTRPIDLVIDAGANLGQFARSIRQKGYLGRIHSFEPVGYVFRALEKASEEDSQWTVTNAALGNKPGTEVMNVFGNHTLSSFLRPTELLRSYDTGAPAATETVNVMTLDEVLLEDSSRYIFLKIDVQGFEKQVLEGARETLSRTIAISIELPVRHIYAGAWDFRDAIEFIDQIGFEPAQFRMVSGQPDDAASAMEFDCVFKRKIALQ